MERGKSVPDRGSNAGKSPKENVYVLDLYKHIYLLDIDVSYFISFKSFFPVMILS